MSTRENLFRRTFRTWRERRAFWRGVNAVRYPGGARDIIGFRTCRVCQRRLPCERFVFIAHHSHPLQWECKDCHNGKKRARYAFTSQSTSSSE